MSASTVRACTREEVEFLLTYRKASKKEKCRLTKVLVAAKENRLPPIEVIKAMTCAEARAFADALPDVNL